VRLRLLVAGLAVLLATVGTTRPASAQSDEPSIDLVVNAGRPLRVALDEQFQLKGVGQIVTGTVTEAVYAYDRIVIQVGTKVRGHVSQIDSGSTFVRARAYMSGNLSPTKHAVLQFDTLLLGEGRRHRRQRRDSARDATGGRRVAIDKPGRHRRSAVE
jgi:hypothetical protein